MEQDRREAYYQDRMLRFGAAHANFDHLTVTTALNLVCTYDVLHQAVGRYLSRAGLSKSTFNILMLLAEADSDGMLLHEIGDMLLVSKANVTGLIDHLEQLGYARRITDPADRRARFAQITSRGRQLIETILPGHFSNLLHLFEQLTGDEKEVLVHLLRKARASIAAGAKRAGVASKAHRSAKGFGKRGIDKHGE